MKKLSSKLVVTPYECGMVSITFRDRKPEDICIESMKSSHQTGDIYIGRVQKVVKNIGCAFLDLGEGVTGYYPLDQKIEPVYTKKGASAVIQQGDELLVQVRKEAAKTKALSLTAELSVPGRYLVAVMGSGKIAVSAKIDHSSKEKWIKMLTPYLQNHIGWIVRTNAQDAQEETILREAEYLCGCFEKILNTAIHRPSGICMYRSEARYLELIKGKKREELDEILTDNREVYREIKEYLEGFQPEDTDKLTFYQDGLQPLYKKYPVELALEEAEKERIWLKSGGYLIIQATEALTAIDVNTGKYDGKKQSEETFLKINLEAALEAARQIRLRNLSGIIIIDFVNMKKESNNQYLLEELSRFLTKDPVPCVLVDMTPLGLVEITRKRTHKSVAEQMRFLKKRQETSL